MDTDPAGFETERVAGSPPPLEEQRARARAQPIDAPEFLRIMVLGRAWGGVSDPVACQIRALISLGHRVVHIDPLQAGLLTAGGFFAGSSGTGFVDVAALRPALRNFQPEILVTLGRGIGVSPEDASRLRADGVGQVAIIPSDWAFERDVTHLVGGADFCGVDSPALLQRLAAAGHPAAALFRVAVDRAYATAQVPDSQELEADVLCIGNATDRPERSRLMKRLAGEFTRTRVVGDGWSNPQGERVADAGRLHAFRAAKVHVVFPDDGMTGSAGAAIFESTAAGAVVISPHDHELGECFRFGEEILGYDDEENLVETIRFLLGQPGRREELRRRAFARLVSEHLYEHRWNAFLSAVQSHRRAIHPSAQTGPGVSPREAAPTVGARKRVRKIVVSGFYGAGNLGDELILRSLSRGLAEEHDSLQLVAASQDPDETSRSQGIAAFSGAVLDRATAEIRSASAVLLGGGGLWHDYSFERSGGVGGLFTHNELSLTGYAKIPLTANILGKPVHVVGMGAGPLNDPDARRFLAFLSRHLDSVTVRDESSKAMLEAIPGWQRPVSVAPDLVYALPLAEGPLPAQIAAAPKETLVIAVAMRPWEQPAPALVREHLADAIGRVGGERDLMLVGVPMQGKLDADAIAELFALVQTPSTKLILDPQPTEYLGNLLATLKRADLVIGMRLHTCILSHRLGSRTLGLAYDPKIAEHFEDIGAAQYCAALDCSASQLAARMEELLAEPARYLERVRDRVTDRERAAVRFIEDLRKRLEASPAVVESVALEVGIAGLPAAGMAPILTGSITSGSTADRQRRVAAKSTVSRGRLEFGLAGTLPQAGDWVAYELELPSGHASADEVLIRLSKRSRKAASRRLVRYELRLNGQLLMSEDLASRGRQAHIQIYGVRRDKANRIGIVLRAERDCREHAADMQFSLRLDALEPVRSSYRGPLRVLSSSPYANVAAAFGQGSLGKTRLQRLIAFGRRAIRGEPGR